MKSIIFVIFMGITVASCLQQSAPTFEEIVKERGKRADPHLVNKPVKVAFATPLLQASDYWRRSIDSFKARLDEIGIPHNVMEFSTKVYENRKLRESIRLALETDPDYLVVTENDKEDKDIITRLLEGKKTRVILQNTTKVRAIWKPNPPFIYVGFDHETGTENIAKEYIRRLGTKKSVKYAVLYHVKGNLVSKLRGHHFNSVISRRTKFKLVAENYTGGNRKRAYLHAKNILKANKNIDFIYACSTDIAFGVIDALKELKMQRKVLVNGWGGGSNELKAVLAKDLSFTLMRLNDDNGVAMAEAIRLDLESKKKLIPQVFSGEMIIVTQESDADHMKFLKRRSFRYSGL